MAKLLLVHPLFLTDSPAERAAASPYFPLGLLYLAAYVRERGHGVAVFDGTFATGPHELSATLAAEAPDVVGISIVQPSRDAALALAAVASGAGCPVIVGGPDPTAEPERYLAEPAIDVVVHHEGEATTVALLDLIDAGPPTADRLAGEPGIAFRRDGSVVINEARAPIEDLDQLPLPARDLIDVDRYLEAWGELAGYRSITVATGRGCPRGCRWCRQSVHGSGFRQRSPEHVAAEVKQLTERYAIDRLRVVDDVDGIDRAFFERWAEAADAAGAAVPFEALNDLDRRDLPLLEVMDTL